VTCPSGILHGVRKYVLLGVQNAKIRLQSSKTKLMPQIIKNKFPHKKDKIKLVFQKIHAIKFLVGLKRKKQASNIRVLVDFKRKKQDCLQDFYCYHENKLFGVYFSHVSCISIFILKVQ
jgi:hypothetical protein